MTLTIMLGRRVPKKWFKRFGASLGKLIGFQEHIWTIIIQSFAKSKRAMNKDGRGTCITEKLRESEDEKYEIEWYRMIIKASDKLTQEEKEAFEQEEYNDVQKMYSPLKQVFKKELPTSQLMKKRIQSKILETSKIDKVYEKGYEFVRDTENMANKLLEMGVLTHIEWIKDFDKEDVNKE